MHLAKLSQKCSSPQSFCSQSDQSKSQASQKKIRMTNFQNFSENRPSARKISGLHATESDYQFYLRLFH